MDSRMSVMVRMPVKSPNSLTTNAMWVDWPRICSRALRMLKLSSRFSGVRINVSRSGSLPASNSLSNSFLCTKPSGSSMRPPRITGRRE
ncbi:hypothetical protein D9M73_246460 [compost metagenome]